MVRLDSFQIDGKCYGSIHEINKLIYAEDENDALDKYIDQSDAEILLPFVYSYIKKGKIVCIQCDLCQTFECSYLYDLIEHIETEHQDTIFEYLMNKLSDKVFPIEAIII